MVFIVFIVIGVCVVLGAIKGAINSW